MSGVAIVTGSSGGIGKEICRKLAGVGYSVVGLDLIPSKDFTTVVCDLSSPGFLAEIPQFDDGQVSLIVHAAASQPTGLIDQLTDADWFSSMNTNLLSIQRLMSRYRIELEKSRGTIITISSIHSFATSPKMAAYAASKAALNGWVRSAAIELGPRIAVIGLAPGAVDTPKLREGLARWPEDERRQVLERLIAKTPMARLGSATEIADWVEFLASPSARFATGTTISLDGGVSAWLGSE